MRILFDYNKYLSYLLCHDIVYEDVDKTLFGYTADMKSILDSIYNYLYMLELFHGWSPSLAFHKDSCYINLIEVKDNQSQEQQSSIYFYSDAFECTLPYSFIFRLFILPLLIFYTLFIFNLYKNRILKNTRKLPYFYRYRHWANMRRYYFGSHFYHTNLTMDIWNSVYFFHSRGSSTLSKKSKYYSRNSRDMHRAKRRRIETIMSWVRYYKHFTLANRFTNPVHNKYWVKRLIFFPSNFFLLSSIFLLIIIYKSLLKKFVVYYSVNGKSLSIKDSHILQKNYLIIWNFVSILCQNFLISDY